MLRHIFIPVVVFFACLDLHAQESGPVPRPIPDFLSDSLFMPSSHIIGLQPWMSAPLALPVVHVVPMNGFEGSIGFGEYSLAHPESFFSTLDGSNCIDVPELYISRQRMLGNTLKIARGFYFLSGILYGAQMGVMGNNWGMGTREGFVFHPSDILTITLWTQYFQSVYIYSPVMFPTTSGDGAAIVMPATPEVFSFGVQASFVWGEFIIGIGTSVAPVRFQDRHHSRFRYR